jgi:hypothetical protein
MPINDSLNKFVFCDYFYNMIQFKVDMTVKEII